MKRKEKKKKNGRASATRPRPLARALRRAQISGPGYACSWRGEEARIRMHVELGLD